MFIRDSCRFLFDHLNVLTCTREWRRLSDYINVISIVLISLRVAEVVALKVFFILVIVAFIVVLWQLIHSLPKLLLLQWWDLYLTLLLALMMMMIWLLDFEDLLDFKGQA